MALLEVSDLTIGYRIRDRRIKAVDSVSFSLRRGETLGLVGESGSGKTTIGMSLLRLLPDNASVLSGTLLFDGQDLLTLSDEAIRAIRGRRIAMIFQAAMNALNPVQRVNEQVAEALRVHDPDLSRQDALHKTRALFDSVGIPDSRHNNYPHQYSGGMKQRAIIAMALSCGPSLLIADEPTTALDVIVQGQILKEIRTIQEKTQVAMVFISHDISVVADICHNIAVMYGGRIIEIGRREEILASPAHPYTRMLLASNLTLADHVYQLPPLPDPDTARDSCGEELAGCPFWPRCPENSAPCRTDVTPRVALSSSHHVFCLNMEKGSSI